MHINDFNDAIKNCRFCFMCRHLSAVGNVRCTEADTPRVRAAMIYGIGTGTNRLDDEDFIATLYRQDLSACCRRNCVKHFDENGLALAARADVVEAGLAPAAVKELAAKFAASAKWTLSGKGDVAYFEDEATAAAKTVAPAFAALAKKAGVKYAVVKGGCIGKVLKVLGYLPEAKAAAEAFAAFVAKAGIKTLVVSNPALCDAIANDYPELGVKFPAKVVSSAAFIAGLGLKFKACGEVYYLADDFLRNYLGCDCAEKLLKALKAQLKPFGTNDEESYCCGEGALVLDKLNPELVKAMAEYVAARADDPKKDVVVVASPYTRRILAKYGKLNVVTLDELAAACI